MTVTQSEAILNDVVITFEKKNYLDAIRSGFVLIFSATMISTLATQFLDSKIEKIISSQNGLSPMIWIWGFLSLMTAILFPLLQSLLCSFYLSKNFLPEKKFSTFLKSHTELSLIETLRSWGKAFLWCFAFIIPGLIKYSYYLLAPYIVVFSKMYQLGDIDALNYSEKIFKKYWAYFSVQLFIFYFLFPALLSVIVDEYRQLNLHPLSAAFSVALEALIILFFHYLIFKKLFFYLQNEKDLNYATDV